MSERDIRHEDGVRRGIYAEVKAELKATRLALDAMREVRLRRVAEVRAAGVGGEAS